MEKFLKILFALIMIMLPLLIKAADCDDIYRQGLEMRKTLTPESQQKAIQLFEQARDCYQDEADKNKCIRQINICCKIMQRLGATPQLNTNPAPAQQPAEAPTDSVAAETPDVPAASPKPTEPSTPVQQATPEQSETTQGEQTPPEQLPAGGFIDTSYEYKFSAKSDDEEAIDITGDDDWHIIIKPEWVNAVIADKQIKISVQENDGGKRNGQVIIQSNKAGVRITITVSQKKKGLF